MKKFVLKDVMAVSDDKESFFRAIFENRTGLKFIMPPEEYPMVGSFVCPGIPADFGKDTNGIIGYVVQVRLNAGLFGSHAVLIRHSDGNLMNHENQSFYEIPTMLHDVLLSHYADQDDYNEVYDDNIAYTMTICGDPNRFPEKEKVVKMRPDDPECYDNSRKNSASTAMTKISITGPDGKVKEQTVILS